MKIDDKPILPVVGPARNDAAAAIADGDTQRGGAAGAVQGGDTVKLSSGVERFAKMSEAVQGLPDIRVERVEELKKSIAAGQYKVNARDVAEKMLMTMKKGVAV
ncbi:MAG: flagellar biosynthesis anti-sigma factor FlgM [Desulfuromonadales bacterium]|nr:MAG: flagellar biosynthesis anti-sigma factor FlgM [Desulfuromonadales bacterium]